MSKYYFYHLWISALFLTVFIYDIYQKGSFLTVMAAILCFILILINSKKNRKLKTTA
ncbi:hypothetical protein BN1080_00346 [Planococcus massiliensis]|uniref:Uncharacterized protein n=1 Tax=Planococcus massiliensis TaxID=1499687 RepID=A0A098EJF0_9BACL|nr:hypothetical protein [Planococcus massiliensis]CEG21436.1 hypothetical protein BN1080_00346 [Planococcus massiliensis]